jgi:hypothetical protein
MQVLHPPQKFEPLPYYTCLIYGIKNCGIEVPVDGITCVLNFVKSTNCFKSYWWGGGHWQTCDLMSLLSSFESTQKNSVFGLVMLPHEQLIADWLTHLGEIGLETGFVVLKRIISALKRLAMSYIIVVLRVCWCSVIVLNVHATCKSNNVKDSLYEELGCIFDQFPRYDVKILLSDLNVKVGSEDVFKLTVRSEGPCEINNGNGVRSSKLWHIEKLSCQNYHIPTWHS